MLPSGGTARLLSLLPMRGGAWGRSLGSRHAVACPLAGQRERRTRECTRACLLALLRVSEVHVHDPVFTRLELFVMVPLLSARVPFRPRVCPFRVHVVRRLCVGFASGVVRLGMYSFC